MDLVKSVFSNKFFVISFSIIASLILLLLLWRLAKYMFKKKSTKLFLVKGVKDARTYEKIAMGEKLDDTSPGLEFTFSTWFYIKDLDYNYSKAKHIFHVGDANAQTVAPGIWIHPRNNNLIIRINTHNSDTPLEDPSAPGLETSCNIENIKIQRWNHLVAVLQNKTLDIYLNGRLKRSCTYKNIPKINTSTAHINKDGGFDGVMSDVFYSNIAYGASQVFDIYRQGHTSINLGHYFSKVYPTIQDLRKGAKGLSMCLKFAKALQK